MQTRYLYEKQLQRLKAYRLRLKTVAFAERFFTLLAVITAILLILPIAYAVGAQDVVFRWLIFLSVWVSLAYLGFRFFIQPLFDLIARPNTPPVDKVALMIGDKFPQIKDDLGNAIQIVQQQSSQDDRASQSLAWAAFARIARQAESLPFEKSLETSQAKRRMGIFAGALALFLLAYTFYPANYSDGFDLLTHPSKNAKWVPIKFEVTPGDTEVVRGQQLEVRARIVGEQIGPLKLLANYNEGKYTDLISLVPKMDRNYAYTFENIGDPFSYQFLVDKSTSPVYHVRVVDLPDIRELQLTLRPPKYTGLPVQKLEPNVGNVSVLPGTKINISITTNKPIEQAVLVFAEKDSIFLAPRGSQYHANLKVRKPGQYFFYLQDDQGLTNKNPITYQIKTIPDQNPVIQITFPARDVDIDESMKTILGFSGEDDFGFSKLELYYTIYRGGPVPGQEQDSLKIPFQANDGKLISRFEWDLTPMNLLPEDVVVYFAEVYDNDYISGPKKARSASYRLRFPSIQEIFAEAAQDQEAAENSFSDMYEKSQQIKETVNEILQEARKDLQLNWEEKQKLKESTGKQEEMFQELEDIKKKIDEMVDRLERNDLLTVETLKKYQELQNLLEEVATPELKKMMEKLQDVLKNMDPRQIQKALEEFQFSQEEFLKNIDKTINMLKQLQAEQRLEEAIKTAQEMIERQEKINQKLQEQKKPSNLDELAYKEKQQKEQLKDLQNALSELQKQMQDLPQMQMPEQLIQQARQQAASQELTSELQQAQQMIQQGQMQQARNSGEKVSRSLQQMRDLLSKAQEKMQQNQQAEVMRQLRKGSRNLLELSKREESLAQQTRQLSSSSPKYRDIADRQEDLLSAMKRVTEQIFQLSQKSFFVPPKIGKKLGQSVNKMQLAIRELEQRRASQASHAQSNAMQALNGAVAELRNAMKNMTGSSSGSSMEQFMQRLMGISGEQQGINQQTRSLGEMGQLSLEQQASLARLAAQQEALRKSLQDLQREFGQRNEILGSLDKIAQQMKEVAGDMRRKNVSRRTIERQQRILSRLLDAQKSVRQRDYSRKRKAETGKTYFGMDPGDLPENLGESQFKIHQDLLRALKENYSKDYKILIQKYFEALTRELKKNESEK